MTASTDTQSIAVQTQVIHGDLVIDLGGTILVSSKSQPGAWHVVADGACTCISFFQRGSCRHLKNARIAEEQDRESAIPMTTLQMQRACVSCGHHAATVGIRCVACSQTHWAGVQS